MNTAPSETKMRRTLAALEAFTVGAAHTAPRLTDEHLEYWGEIYVRHQMQRTGVLFETFLRDPHVLAPQLLARLTAPRVRAITVPCTAPDPERHLDLPVFLRKQAD